MTWDEDPYFSVSQIDTVGIFIHIIRFGYFYEGFGECLEWVLGGVLGLGLG